MTTQPQQPEPGLAQTFLAILVNFGKTRELGLEPGSEIVRQFCPACNAETDHLLANGEAICVRTSQHSGVCLSCGGLGRIDDYPCPDCGGTGQAN